MVNVSKKVGSIIKISIDGKDLEKKKDTKDVKIKLDVSFDAY
jgi:hypothetical protein